MTALVAFALASALHAGFQGTVTALVYPVLGARSPAEWRAAHARHSRSIAPLVVAVYAAVVLSGGAFVVDSPDLVGWLALAGAAGALFVTATLAAPLHGRLSDKDDTLVHRLLVADRARCVFAVMGAVLAVLAVVTGG